MNRTSSNSQLNHIGQIGRIMNRQNASTEEKFFQAQLVAKKIEAGGSQRHLLDSITAKMEILKGLAYNNQ